MHPAAVPMLLRPRSRVANYKIPNLEEPAGVATPEADPVHIPCIPVYVPCSILYPKNFPYIELSYFGHICRSES